MSRYDGGVNGKEKKEKAETKEKNVEVQIDDVLRKAVKHSETLRQMDEANPLEQAKKYEEIRKNPPKKDFMKVECFEAEDADGNRCIISRSKIPDGYKFISHNPFFTVDLKSAIEADVAACPANVGPLILEESIKLAKLKKETFKPVKRKDENKMMVLLIIVMVTIMAGAGAYGILQFF